MFAAVHSVITQEPIKTLCIYIPAVITPPKDIVIYFQYERPSKSFGMVRFVLSVIQSVTNMFLQKAHNLARIRDNQRKLDSALFHCRRAPVV